MIKGCYEECYECIVNKRIYNVDLPEDIKKDYIKKQLDKINAIDEFDSSFELNDLLNEEYEKYFPPIDFSSINYHFNEMMLNLFERFKQEIHKSTNPLFYALKLSLAANYIDYAAFKDISEDKLMALLEDAKNIDLSEEVFNDLRKELIKAKKLVYVTDNCGEIVMDKLFVEEILKLNPNLQISFILKNAKALNDATIADAKQVGLDKMGEIMHNGLSGQRTIISKLPKYVKETLDSGDVIIAKGQANAESYAGCGLNVYYILLCKCVRFAKVFQKNIMEGILAKERKDA